jgi:hypothetical protein
VKKIAIVVAVSAAFVLPAQGQSTRQGNDWSKSYAQAQGAKKSQKRVKQRTAQRPRQATSKPCAAYYWGGCLGWDPDPHVRAMIQHDRNIWDD